MAVFSILGWVLLPDLQAIVLLLLSALLTAWAIGSAFLARVAATQHQAKVSFQSALDHLIEGCQIINKDFRYLYVNEAVAGQGKRTKRELIGHTMMEMYPGIDQTEVFKHIKDCLAHRQPYQMENEFEFPDGSKGWFELRIEPVPEGVFVLSLDITDRKKAEKQLLERTTELERLNNVMVGRELKLAKMKKLLKNSPVVNE